MYVKSAGSAETLQIQSKLISQYSSFPVVSCLQISCGACPACVLANAHQSSQSDCDMIYIHTLNASCTLQTALIRNATIDCEEGNHSGTYPQSKAKNLHSFNINILCSACPRWFGTSSEVRSVVDSFYLKNDP